MGWLNMSTALFILLVLPQSLSHAEENVYKKVKFSSNLNTLLEYVLGGCSIQIILRPKVSMHEKIVSLLQEKTDLSTSYKTFLIKAYETRLHSYSHITPSWQLRQHTFCRVHLYLLSTGKDLYEMEKFLFHEFTLRLDYPDYMLLWNLGFTRHTYLRTIQKENFVKLFTDYRLLIERNRGDKTFDIKLICIVCSWNIPTESVKTIDGNVSGEKIHSLWAHWHSDHFQLPSIECQGCKTYSIRYLPHQLRPIHGTRLSFPEFVIERFNATEIGENQVDSLGEVHWHIRGADEYYGLPDVIWPPGFAVKKDYHLFTVARKTLLRANGWTSFLNPVNGNLWYTILAAVMAVTALLTITSRRSEKLPFVLLCVFGPMTDHWWIPPSKPSWKYILGLWGILCFSLTILYGGDLASSLSLLSPPLYPKDIPDFVLHDVQFLSLDNRGDEIAFSPFAEFLKFRTDGAPNSAKFMRVAKEISESICNWNSVVLTHKHQEAPYRCDSKSISLRTDVPITFVDTHWLYIATKTTFERSDLYWVSPTTVAKDFSEEMILYFDSNYFGKLALSVVSYWMASGLEAHLQNNIDLRSGKSFFDTKSGAIPEDDITLRAFSQLDFKPVTIRAVEYVFRLTLALFGISALVLMAELIPHLSYRPLIRPYLVRTVLSFGQKKQQNKDVLIEPKSVLSVVILNVS